MTDLAPIEVGPLTLFGDATPHAIVARATAIADVIAPLIRERQLAKRIGQSEHVFLEGWTLAGTMLGVFAVTVRTWEIGDDDGYGATVEARTLAGGLVGRADAVVMRSEEVGGKCKWLEAPAFQLLSMAQTRGSSKALRTPHGFVMKLAGYDTTPAEEMEAAAARGETVTGGRGVAPGWRDIGEQERGHAQIAELLDTSAPWLREWVTKWLDSKGYTRPLAKGQLNQLRRAIDRELEERDDQKNHEAHEDGKDGRPAQAVAKPARAGAPTSPVAAGPPVATGGSASNSGRAAGRGTRTANPELDQTAAEPAEEGEAPAGSAPNHPENGGP
jgi:hypothetical protein